MDFQKPYDLLWEMPQTARVEALTKRAKNELNTEWWCVLAGARTFFEKGGL
jgi:hypothetical protein